MGDSDAIGNERGSPRSHVGHLTVIARSRVPPADGQEGPQIGVVIFVLGEGAITSVKALPAWVGVNQAAIDVRRQEVEPGIENVHFPGFFICAVVMRIINQIGEAVKDVGTNLRVYVAGSELTIAWSAHTLTYYNNERNLSNSYL